MDMTTAVTFPETTGATTENSTVFVPFNHVAHVLAAATLIPLTTFSLFANTVIIIAIIRYMEKGSTLKYFLLNLCVSDLISAMVTPFVLYRQTWGFIEWMLPSIVCKLTFAIETFTGMSTSLLIFFFTVYRLACVVSSSTMDRISGLTIILAFIWILSFGFGFIPYAVWFDANLRKTDATAFERNAAWPDCVLAVQWLSTFQAFYSVVIPIFYIVPMVGIVIISPLTVVIIKVRSMKFEHEEAAKRRRKTEKKIMIQLAVITSLFILGNIGAVFYVIYTTSRSPSTPGLAILDWNFYIVCFILRRVSECLNPVLYNFASGKLRRGTLTLLRGMVCCSRSSPDQGHEWTKGAMKASNHRKPLAPV